MIEARAPGKLFIAGEYAVVEPRQPAIVVAVNRFIRVTLTPAWRSETASRSPYVAAALDVVERLRHQRGIAAQHYDIEVHSELENERGIKLGLGSSAAVTVALIDALGQLYDLRLDPLTRFKLSLLATITVSPLASGGDLAASTFGGWLRYSSPDRALLAADLATGDVDQALTSEGWHGFEVRPLTAPPGCELLVGWTGSPASTDELVNGVVQSPRDAGQSARAQSPSQRQAFLSESREIVETITNALESETAASESAAAELAASVRQARSLLQRLGQETHTLIETPKLKALCEIAEQHGAAAKPSGAGGGDCGIVLITATSDRSSIVQEWARQQITHLDLAVHVAARTNEGGSVER